MNLDDVMKSTNPKDLINNKLPLHLWPASATAVGCLGMLEGVLKYGLANYRAEGVRVSTYIAALKRHVDAYYEGEELTPEAHQRHLGNALACLAILVDAAAHGCLKDDRPYRGGEGVQGYNGLVRTLIPEVTKLRELFKEAKPVHHLQVASPPTVGDRPVWVRVVPTMSEVKVKVKSKPKGSKRPR